MKTERCNYFLQKKTTQKLKTIYPFLSSVNTVVDFIILFTEVHRARTHYADNTFKILFNFFQSASTGYMIHGIKYV